MQPSEIIALATLLPMVLLTLIRSVRIDKALNRVQDLGNRPKHPAPDNNPWTEDYLLGYQHAMDAVQQAIDNPSSPVR